MFQLTWLFRVSATFEVKMAQRGSAHGTFSCAQLQAHSLPLVPDLFLPTQRPLHSCIPSPRNALSFTISLPTASSSLNSQPTRYFLREALPVRPPPRPNSSPQVSSSWAPTHNSLCISGNVLVYFLKSTLNCD